MNRRINEKEYPIMNDEELHDLIEAYEFATKEELLNYIIVYHRELKKYTE